MPVRPDHLRSDAVPDTVLVTQTGRYLHDIELPPSLHPAFPKSPDAPFFRAEPPRCIASKGRPTEDGIIRLGLYPPLVPSRRSELEYFLVPADAVIFTSIRP
jgi:hypothetical protein